MKKSPADLAIEKRCDELEVRVDELITLCERLREENHALRARQSMLLAERADLIDRNEVARNRVESIISRLKDMEEEV
jgi:cell division protein ZapB